MSEAEREKFGGVLNQYYGFLDTLVGREIERLGPNDLLLVVSAFGMEPLSPGKRVLEIIAGNPQISGTHERAPDGFVLAFGATVAPGRPPRASVVDLAPTILYFLGLAGRPRHGWLRAHRPVQAGVHERQAGDLHPVVRTVDALPHLDCARARIQAIMRADS